TFGCIHLPLFRHNGGAWDFHLATRLESIKTRRAGLDHCDFHCDLWRFLVSQQGIGEGGIRTLGTLLRYGALAKRCFRPLSHLTKAVARIWGCPIARQMNDIL